jgi:hypothetical protein
MFNSPNRFSPLAPEYSPLAYVDVDVKAEESEEWVTTRAMVDCGGQGSFINDKFSHQHQLPRRPKSYPVSLVLADGSQSQAGHLTQYNPVLLRTADNEEQLGLDIAPTSHNIILGMPWLKKHDPSVRFGSQTLTFDSPFCQANCNHYGKTVPLHSTPRTEAQLHNLGEERIDQRDGSRKALPPRSPSEISRPQVQRETPSPDFVDPPPVPTRSEPSAHPDGTPDRDATVVPQSAVQDHHVKPKSNASVASRRAKPPPSSRVPVFSKPPPVSIVGVHAFARLCNQPGVELFTVSFSDISPESIELSSSEVHEGPTEPDLSLIPEEYRDLAEIFTQREADKLPPHRPYDHTIPLEPGATPPFGTIYPMSPTELETLRKYVEDNLRKGFIRHSQSPCGAPILFVKKPDGTLRLCVDYRGLNKITTKNRYPLPLIGELLDRISRAKFFTKFDVRDGYHRLRMADGEEWKTAFRCRYGLFEYNVMPFGLCNAPGTFQHYMNDTFREFLDRFLIIYLDDLLIYSDTLAEHRRHVRMVLERLQEAELCLKPSKCQFHVQEVAFLGFLVGPNGVKMDPAKVEAITSWPIPKSAQDIRMFIGLANFYRRFIKNFSKMAAPMTALLKKNRRFQWTQEAQSSFDELRSAFTTAPILRHFNPSLPTVVEADASDYAEGGVISQRDPGTGELHPIAFWSRKFNPAELNYEIYDKEMLAIVDTMEHYRHYFEGLGQQTVIFSDHKNLLWFTETKVYNRRQARWAEKLARFDFKIVFRPGKRGGKPDALSRRPDYTLGKDVGERTMTFLKPEQVDTSLLDPEDPTLASYLLYVAETSPAEPDVDTRSQSILAALDQDPEVGPLLPQIRDPTLPRDEETAEFLQTFSRDEDGLIRRHGRVYVPAVDEIKVGILQEHHDAKTAGHLGQEKTLELVSRNYYWPRMRQFVNEYVNTCEMCVRNKATRHAPFGNLQPLPIPAGPWQSVSMDFIVELPPSEGYDAIFVCVDRLTKMAHFIPTTSDVTAERTAQLYCRHVWKHHGLPLDTVSDRGPQFVSHFTRHLLKRLDIKGNRSTAYHPQSDGQTERVNQTLEQYLRIYCDYQQDDWHQLLPLAEFVYNNAQNSSTRMSPFFANYGYHPRCSVTVATSDSTNPAAEALVDRLQAIHAELKDNLQRAQERYKEQHDRHTRAPPTIAAGDKVWLNRRNIQTTRPSRKLDVKRMGPFKVLEVIGEGKLAFKLELPAQMRIHPVFHVSLLEPYRENVLPGRVQTVPPPAEVEGDLEYEVERILDSKIERRKLKYLVDWVGYGPEERTWEPAEHLEHAADAMVAFHRAYLLRPSPQDLTRPRDPPRPPPRRR